jgi:hypothetical protein
MQGGTGWQIKNSEFWGARSYAALFTAGGADKFYVGYNTIHDTYPSNATAQDHLIYVYEATDGVIERNLLYNSPNGRAVKVGSLSNDVTYPRNITVRYNTLYGNLGPSNIQFDRAANNNRAYRNIYQKPKSTHQNVTHYELTGTNNVVSDNIGWESVGLIEPNNGGLVDGGGNQSADPQFADIGSNDFHPRNPGVEGYGRYAP